jgi:hypothetical protein
MRATIPVISSHFIKPPQECLFKGKSYEVFSHDEALLSILQIGSFSLL